MRNFFNKDVVGFKFWRKDLVAGLSVAIIAIPQCMAYALLAGMPPIYGLYACLVPLLIYPLFGSSVHLSVGPVALVSIIMLGELSALAEPGTERYIQLALLASLVAGIIQVVLGMFRAGFLVNFLSLPVIKGFTSGAAIIIIMSQLKHIIGCKIQNNSDIVGLGSGLWNGLGNINISSLSVGLGSLTILMLLKWRKSKIPGALLVSVLGICLVYFFKDGLTELDIIGSIPSGLPQFSISFINLDDLQKIMPLALIICLISFIESLSIAKSLVDSSDKRIDADKELFGLGMAKVVGSFFQAFPNTGSFGRSAINAESGSTSGRSSIFAAISIALALFFLTPVLYYYPKAILGAVVISAVIKLIDIAYANRLLKFHRNDFLVFILTFIGTLILGIQNGVIIGILLSLMLVLAQSAKPHYAILGRLENTSDFRNINRYPEAMTYPGTLIIRYDKDLFFANADHFTTMIQSEIENNNSLDRIILSAVGINRMDSTGFKALKDGYQFCNERNISFIMTGVVGPVRDMLYETGLYEEIGKQNFFLNIPDALKAGDGNYTSRGEEGTFRFYSNS